MHDLDADYYRSHSSRQYDKAMEMLKRFDLKGDETILDIGCGDGRITAELSKRLPSGSIIGVDSSPAMIKLAQASFAKEKYPNLSFQNRSVEELNFDPSFDFIYMFNVLHWVRNPRKAISNIATSLKKGGELHILTSPKESPSWRYLGKTMEDPQWQSFKEKTPYKSILSSKEYSELIEKSGLTIETC